jgi:hypothetical protein
MAVGDEACDQVDQKVDGAAMARMLDLADVFVLIIQEWLDRQTPDADRWEQGDKPQARWSR